MTRGHRSATMIALASTPLEVPTLSFTPFLSWALDDDVCSPLSFSPFPLMCATLSSPCCATAGISSTPVGLPSEDIAMAAATTTTIATSVTAFLLLHRVCPPPPNSSSFSLSSTPPKSRLHLQSVRVMAVAAAAGGGSGGYALPPLPQTHLFNRLGG